MANSTCGSCGKPARVKWCSSACRAKGWRDADPEKYLADNRQRLRGLYEPAVPVCRIKVCTCEACGRLFVARAAKGASVCRDSECRRQYQAERMKGYKDLLRINRQVRRARERNAKSERISPAKVYARDGWMCGICGDAVDPELIYPAPMSVSLDHIVPISLDGDHVWENVRCAHLVCNMRRGNRVDA